jgi:hypothetical protein
MLALEEAHLNIGMVQTFFFPVKDSLGNISEEAMRI